MSSTKRCHSQLRDLTPDHHLERNTFKETPSGHTRENSLGDFSVSHFSQMQLIPREETTLLNGFRLILSVIFAWKNE